MEQHAMHSMTTSSPSAEMGKHAGMHMSNCKISMLWNWNTIDSCFLSSTWHITSTSEFAGSCIGVICLVLILEFLRRIGREYDAFIIRRARLRHQYLSPSLTDASTAASASAPAPAPAPSTPYTSPPNSPKPTASTNTATATSVSTPATTPPPTIRPKPTEQLIRALLHMLQFAVAYFIMLLAMYFNGYIIICIFIGAFLGALIFSWEGLGGEGHWNDATAVTKCCG
ncbi:Ctr copper transporter family-domain-containing protein [Aspergillus taichungensis]|uniref:Copper transport protein n=1 Tax=Aspergillus taichungensis TaxID=482145 RepID=A0A2J5I8F2_9EURO|nr:Ctr copper transporter family-domain-containing protein [Aspergillus taichungensis]